MNKKILLMSLLLATLLVGCAKKDDGEVLTPTDSDTPKTEVVTPVDGEEVEEITDTQQNDEEQSNEEGNTTNEQTDEQEETPNGVVSENPAVVEPNTSTGGSTTTTKPNTSTGGSTTTTKPSTSTGGSTATTKPNTSTGGSTATTKPNTSTGGTTTKPAETKPSTSTGGTTTKPAETTPNTNTGGTTASKPKDVVTTKTVYEEKVISFTTVEEKDPNLEKGKRVVKRQGVDGVSKSEYLVTYTNSKETSRKLIATTTSRQPVSQIISVGTKEAVEETYEQTYKSKVRIPYKTVYVDDATLNKGQRVQKQAGQNGQKEVTYRTVYQGDKIIEESVVSEKVLVEAVDQIILVGTKEPTPEEDITVSKQAFELINDYRESKGLARLSWADDIYRMALTRSKEIIEVFDHTRPDGSGFWSVGNVRFENLGAGQGTPQAIVNAWINSPSHNGNLLTKGATQAAVAVIKIPGQGYGIFWTFLGR